MDRGVYPMNVRAVAERLARSSRYTREEWLLPVFDAWAAGLSDDEIADAARALGSPHALGEALRLLTTGEWTHDELVAMTGGTMAAAFGRLGDEMAAALQEGLKETWLGRLVMRCVGWLDRRAGG